MHSALRDRYAAQGKTLRVAQLVLSVVATAFAFAGDNADVALLGLTANRTTWLGWVAVMILTLSIVDLVFDKSGHAGQHDSAVRQLATLKAGYRVDPAPEEESAHLDQMTERYETTMDSIPSIPERLFVRLKARHLRKVEVSRVLSDHPGMSAHDAARRVRRKAHESNAGRRHVPRG